MYVRMHCEGAAYNLQCVQHNLTQDQLQDQLHLLAAENLYARESRTLMLS